MLKNYIDNNNSKKNIYFIIQCFIDIFFNATLM